jgi:hypothetical protein
MTKIYARDLAKDKRTDIFMGEGFEEAVRQAEANDTDLVIGEFCKNSEWCEE